MSQPFDDRHDDGGTPPGSGGGAQPGQAEPARPAGGPDSSDGRD